MGGYNDEEFHKDWWCPNCEFLIYGSKASCKKCGMERSEVEESKKSRGKGKKGRRDYDDSDDDGDEWHEDWWCYNCEFKIYGSKAECSKCGEKRENGGRIRKKGKGKGKDGKSSKGGKDRKGSKSQSREGNDWYCPTCDFNIYGFKDECSKCGATREECKKDQDWYCSTCDFMIYSWKESCQKCGQTRRDAVKEEARRQERRAEKAENDWWCPTCDFSIYGFKTECSKCGFAKEDAEGQSGGSRGAKGKSKNRDRSYERKRDRSYDDWEEDSSEWGYGGKSSKGGKKGKGKRERGKSDWSDDHGEKEWHADWWCPNCDFKVYGSKPKCTKCGERRDDVERKRGSPPNYPPPARRLDASYDR